MATAMTVDGEGVLLFQASATGDAAGVARLLRAGAQVYWKGEPVAGLICLLMAASNGRTAVVRYLLDRGVSLEAKLDVGLHPKQLRHTELIAVVCTACQIDQAVSRRLLSRAAASGRNAQLGDLARTLATSKRRTSVARLLSERAKV